MLSPEFLATARCIRDNAWISLEKFKIHTIKCNEIRAISDDGEIERKSLTHFKQGKKIFWFPGNGPFFFPLRSWRGSGSLRVREDMAGEAIDAAVRIPGKEAACSENAKEIGSITSASALAEIVNFDKGFG